MAEFSKFIGVAVGVCKHVNDNASIRLCVKGLKRLGMETASRLADLAGGYRLLIEILQLSMERESVCVCAEVCLTYLSHRKGVVLFL